VAVAGAIRRGLTPSRTSSSAMSAGILHGLRAEDPQRGAGGGKVVQQWSQQGGVHRLGKLRQGLR